MRSGEDRGRPVARIVVQEPARALLCAGFAGALEVLSLQREREAIARRQRRARRPDLQVHFDDLSGLELLRLVVRVPGLILRRASRLELPLRNAQPALRDRGLGLDRREERDFLSVGAESAQRSEDIHVIRARRYEKLRLDRAGEFDRTIEGRGAEGDT